MGIPITGVVYDISIVAIRARTETDVDQSKHNRECTALQYSMSVQRARDEEVILFHITMVDRATPEGHFSHAGSSPIHL